MRSRSSLPSLVLNVPAIARRSPDEVQLLLGSPDTADGPQVSLQVKRTYQRGRVEIVYVENRAKWIKLYDGRDLVFGPDALPKLGLPALRPTYRNPNHVMSWQNLPRLQEVSLYAGAAGHVSSVLVCVETSPQQKKRRSSGAFWRRRKTPSPT